MDIGNIEKGDESECLGVFKSKTDAEKMCETAYKYHCNKYSNAKHHFEVFEVRDIE